MGKDNYSVTVKWSSGEKITDNGYSLKEAQAIADFFFAIDTVDDVFIRCACNECETCHDRAIFESGV